MSTICLYMEREHQSCDEQYMLAESYVVQDDWDRAAREFSQFHMLFELHLRREEQVLFPHLDRASGQAAGPTSVMRAEHGHMRAVVDQMSAAVTAHASDDFFDHADTLRMLMRQHNLKEEGVLYPMADRLFEGRCAPLLEMMDDVGKMPAVAGVAA